MYRFTIRELVSLTLIVALALGWWLDRRALIAESTARRERIYDLTIKLKGRYPRISEMSPPWRDPFEVSREDPKHDSLDLTGSEPAKPSKWGRSVVTTMPKELFSIQSDIKWLRATIRPCPTGIETILYFTANGDQLSVAFNSLPDSRFFRELCQLGRLAILEFSPAERGWLEGGRYVIQLYDDEKCEASRTSSDYVRWGPISDVASPGPHSAGEGPPDASQ